MSGSKKQKTIEAMPRDLEKAAQPIMDRAQRVKEQVTLATADVKVSVEAKAQAIRDKSERLVEAGGKMARETQEVLTEPEAQTFRQRYGLRGGKLFGLTLVFVILAIVCVALLIWSRYQ